MSSHGLSKYLRVMYELWDCHMSFRGIFFLQDALGTYVGLYKGHPRGSTEWYIILEDRVVREATKEVNLLSSNMDAFDLPVFRPVPYHQEAYFFSDGRKVKVSSTRNTRDVTKTTTL